MTISITMNLFLGTFVECIKQSNNSAEQLLKLIVKDFECFKDEADYKGQRGKSILSIIFQF